MTVSHHNASTARFYALRLLPGQEVFSQLHAFVQQNQLHAAWIAGCTGSLTVFEHWLATCRARGTSVVAISHDAAFTRRHFSRVVRLENGRLSKGE
ncbi:DUF296 domain-containing protein [Salmonella enterica]|nr:DUF296 domain-containing protein [Salmonella enterica]